jgi:hypothetical protein
MIGISSAAAYNNSAVVTFSMQLAGIPYGMIVSSGGRIPV